MKVLVTGGTGFLGRHVVWRLASEGVEVIFTGRRREAAETVLHLVPVPISAPVPVRWQPVEHGTRQAIQTLTDCASGVDAVVHCAALSAPWGKEADFLQANVSSTAEVLAACATNAVQRLVHISTPSLYFDFRDRIGIREDQPLPPPVNTYARTKAEAEALVHRDAPCETVILRPRALFGEWDETLMPRLLRVMRRGAIPLMRGGRAQLDLTYVGNAVDAIWLALTRPLSHRIATYNVSNGEPVELEPLLARLATEFDLPLRTRRFPWPLISGIAQLLEAAARLHGREPVLTRYGAGVLAFSQTLDISAIRRDLGYVPDVSIDEGIRRHAEWWRGQRHATAA